MIGYCGQTRAADLVAELEALGIGEPELRFELFDGAHGGIEWRYPEAIGWLAERLSA